MDERKKANAIIMTVSFLTMALIIVYSYVSIRVSSNSEKESVQDTTEKITLAKETEAETENEKAVLQKEKNNQYTKMFSEGSIKKAGTITRITSTLKDKTITTMYDKNVITISYNNGNKVELVKNGEFNYLRMVITDSEGIQTEQKYKAKAEDDSAFWNENEYYTEINYQNLTNVCYERTEKKNDKIYDVVAAVLQEEDVDKKTEIYIEANNSKIQSIETVQMGFGDEALTVLIEFYEKTDCQQIDGMDYTETTTEDLFSRYACAILYADIAEN